MKMITRRELLKGAGVAAAATLPLTPRTAFAHEDMGGSGGGSQVSDRLRRWVMVIDQRACDGCVGLGTPPQCTQNCNWSRFVPDNQQWIEVYEQQVSHLDEGDKHFIPAPCMQCQNAPCVNVCPVGATFHAPEGTVLVDQERCIGCRLCMAACPYDRRFFNWGDPVQPPQVKSAPYNVQTQVPAIKGTVMKCDFCTDRASAGGLPVCVEACPRHAIYFGDLEAGIATNGAQMVQLSSLLEQDGVQRYKEELGTEPRVYYIPGHGENAGAADEGASGEAEPHSDMVAAGVMKDKLEWPWREINAHLASIGYAPAAAGSEGGDG